MLYTIIHCLQLQARHVCCLLKGSLEARASNREPRPVNVTDGVPQQSLQQLVNDTQQAVQLIKDDLIHVEVEEWGTLLAEGIRSSWICFRTLLVSRQRRRPSFWDSCLSSVEVGPSGVEENLPMSMH